MEKLKSAEFWFKIALIFVFGGFFVLSIPFPPESKQFPQLLSSVGLLLVATALAMDFLRITRPAGEIGGVDDTELTVQDTATRAVRRRRFYTAWSIMLVSAAVGMLGGFLYSTALLFVGFGLAFGDGKRRARILIVAAAMTALVYGVFGVVMGVPLLDGIL